MNEGNIIDILFHDLHKETKISDLPCKHTLSK